MPFKSKAQERFLFATRPAMARRWAKLTTKQLPEKVKDERSSDQNADHKNQGN